MKVLVVGMVDSVHLARWAANLVGYPAEFYFLGTSPYRKTHANLVHLSKEASNIHLIRRIGILPVLSWILDRVFADFWRGLVVYRQVKILQPDLIHVNQLQMAGYPVLRALRMLKSSRPRLWSTNYGSELSWYLGKKGHKAALRLLMSQSEYFSAECQRDYRLAESAGFRGQTMECVPVSGSLQPNFVAGTKVRRYIAVKGYQTRWGLGLAALRQAFKFVGGKAGKGYEIFAFSCTLPTYLYCWFKKTFQRSKVTFFYKGTLNHDQVLAHLAKSIIYVGASKADGISTSMIEAMSQGAFPIQTSTSCASEWLSPNSGVLLKVDEVNSLASIINDLLSGATDFEASRNLNFTTIASRLNPSVVREKIWSSYDVALG